MAFDLKEPWGTHRKYQVFDEKHTDLFARPEVTADRIVACHLMARIIQNESAKINNTLFGKYVLTKFAILYILRLILEADSVGKEAMLAPDKFVRKMDDRKNFEKCIQRLVADIIVDVNGEVDEIGDEFDYRGKLRDAVWIKELAKKVVGNHIKLVQRERIPSFGSEWNEAQTKAPVQSRPKKI